MLGIKTLGINTVKSYCKIILLNHKVNKVASCKEMLKKHFSSSFNHHAQCSVLDLENHHCLLHLQIGYQL